MHQPQKALDVGFYQLGAALNLWLWQEIGVYSKVDPQVFPGGQFSLLVAIVELRSKAGQFDAHGSQLPVVPVKFP